MTTRAISIYHWPVADRSYDRWCIQELTEQPDSPVEWRDRRILTESGHVRMNVHLDLATARHPQNR